ncbi:MAG: YetF domain-containing protein [Bacillota bacterium]
MPEPLIKVFLYSIIIYVLLVVLARIIGKKLLSQLNFFDFVIAITIGTITATFVTTEIKGFYVLISPIILTILVILTGYLTLKSVPARKLIEGEPIIVIQNGHVFEKSMRKIRYNMDTLMAQLRNMGAFNLSEVEFAILEPSGRLSVLKKSQNLPVTPSDLGLSTNYKGISSEIIRDGKIVEQNLKQNNLTHEWLYKQLASFNVKDIDNVFIATLSTDGKLYIDLRKDNPGYIQEVEDDDSVI